jgi:hypothetical protein
MDLYIPTPYIEETSVSRRNPGADGNTKTRLIAAVRRQENLYASFSALLVDH